MNVAYIGNEKLVQKVKNFNNFFNENWVEKNIFKIFKKDVDIVQQEC